MNIRHALLPLALALALPSVADAARGFEVRDMAYLDRHSSPTLSPDGRVLVFAKRVVDKSTNKASTSLWMRNLASRDMRPPQRLTPDGWNVNSPAFSADGKFVYFLSAKGGSQQVYRVAVAGGEPQKLTHFPLDVGTYKFSPDGRRLAVTMDVFPECGALIECTTTKLKAREAATASGVLYDQTFVRHWDTWSDGRLSQLFVTFPHLVKNAYIAWVGVNEPVQGDIPSKPFGDASDYTWSPDSQSISFSLRVADRKQPWSTNFDIYLHSMKSPMGPTRNLTGPGSNASNPAWDAGPVFSADGKTLYYRAMQRPGFEADRFSLMAMDLASGKAREIAPRWDASPDGITLSADGKWLYTTAQELGRHPLFRVSLANGEVESVVKDGSVSSFDLAGSTLAFSRNSMQSGDVIATTSADGKAPLRAITPSAGEMLPDVSWGEYEQFNFIGWNNETVHGYVVKPWNFDPGKKYPVAFLIHGGPQGSFGDGWSYRWNPQTYAGQGYAVVMIDFHGSTGYGQKFTDSISQHWGDRPLEDLQKGWAAAQRKYPFLDGDKACALGASYGGYMTNWIAGNWFEAGGSAPFKCLVTHNGVFDTRSMALVTEELWFTEWEFGGTVWDKPEAYERFNPARHVQKWKTPTLIVAGQNDFRVPIDQSLSAFTALQRRGVESKLLYFPDENHWVLKPQNSVLWHDTVNGWLKQHIGQ